MHAADEITPPSDLRSHLEAVIAQLDQPAALIMGLDQIIAFNEPWHDAVRRESHAKRAAVTDPNEVASDSATDLLAFLRNRVDPRTVSTLEPSHFLLYEDFQTDLIEFHTSGEARQLSILFLRRIDPTTIALKAIQDSRDTLISELLIRQTLIEEAERRRLGEFLHDVVTQDLAQIRQMVIDGATQSGDLSECVGMIDRAINNMRTLTFELSPPVLEDIGLYAAVHWLAEHLGKRYGCRIDVVDDGHSPALSRRTRTIVFRAIRELLINACKHAHGSEIVASFMATRRGSRIIIRDTGPGLIRTNTGTMGEGTSCFGLASVERQLRAIGVHFEISSAPGDGTKATIIIPNDRK